MKQRIRNAKGIEVAVRPVTTDELLKYGSRLANELSSLPEVVGVMAIGSCAYSCTDEFSDLDLRIFTKGEVNLIDRLDGICRKMGGVTDDEWLSIHFPLDSPAYLFDNLYVELEVLNFVCLVLINALIRSFHESKANDIDELEDMIESFLTGKNLDYRLIHDYGLIHSLRTGKLLFDRDVEIASLQERFLSFTYPDAYRLLQFALMSQ